MVRVKNNTRRWFDVKVAEKIEAGGKLLKAQKNNLQIEK